MNGVNAPSPEFLPEGITHLYGALYLVPFELIAVADIHSEGEKYQFANPRTLTERGQQELFDRRSCEVLRNDIRDRTLMAPFICRWADVGSGIRPQLVGGERRWRALDKLIDEKTPVKDVNSPKLNVIGEYQYDIRPANEVYEYVICQIYSAKSDIDALALSYSENACRVNLNEGHDVAIFQELRNAHASDEKIMEIMHKDAKWLRDTDQLIANLDEDSLKDLIEDRIDRDSAKSLMKIEDVETRKKVRVAANAASLEDANRRRARYQKKVEDALEEQEIASGSVAYAKRSGNTSSIEKAQVQLDDADKKVERVTAERDKKKPLTKKKHVVHVQHQITGEDSTNKQILRAPKIQQHYVDYLNSIIQNNGKCPDETFEIDVNVLNFGLSIASAIMSGKTNCADICRKFSQD
jgi:hypothetical protein